MIAALVILNGLLVAFEMFLYVMYGGPILLACLVFTVLMFVWTLFSAARS